MTSDPPVAVAVAVAGLGLSCDLRRLIKLVVVEVPDWPQAVRGRSYGHGVTRHDGGARRNPLPDHVQRRRVFLPPIAATGALQLGDWVRDDLPDLLWPILELDARGERSFRQYVEWMKDVHADLQGQADPLFLADCLDGRLTGLERLADEVPSAASIVRSRAKKHGLLSERVAGALASYPYRPAEWLVRRSVEPPSVADVETVQRAMHAVIEDGHREALVKCLQTWSAAIAGVLRTDATFIKLLKFYPDDSGTRDAADSAIRAAWGARKALDAVQLNERAISGARWARVFWGANSMTTRCLRGREVKPNEEETTVRSGNDEQEARNCDPEGNSSLEEGAEPPLTEMPEAGAHLRRLALDLVASYVEATETAPRSLYDREMYEVHAGLVGRAGREVITALGYPDVWSVEHGAHVGRTLTEITIYLGWMATQDRDIYHRYQDYGAGKAKLYAQILQEVSEEVRNEEFDAGIEELRRFSHNDSGIDVRIVDTSDTFSGKSIRKMAEECGLLDLYRRTYYLASGVAHSEWWSVEMHATEQCLNVLHGGHRITSLSLSEGANVELATSWVNTLHSVIWRSLGIIGTDRDIAESVFRWTKGAD